MSKLDSTRLRELLEYNPDTGVFTWRVAAHRNASSNKVAGYVGANGYRTIRVDGQGYSAHRLAWQYTHGVPPTDSIDHINGVRDDNRIANLREATQAQNTQNRKRPQGKNPYLGVYWYAQRNKWRAIIVLDGHSKHIGLFTTAEEARDAYLAAKKEIHPFANTERKA